MRISSVTIVHLGKLWKAKFFILGDVMFVGKLQGKFVLDCSWEWKGSCLCLYEWNVSVLYLRFMHASCYTGPMLHETWLCNKCLTQLVTFGWDLLWGMGYPLSSSYVEGEMKFLKLGFFSVFFFSVSTGGIFIPASSAVGAGLQSIVTYGGLVLFGGFVLYDTQKIIHRAETHPTFGGRPYDPINA